MSFRSRLANCADETAYIIDLQLDGIPLESLRAATRYACRGGKGFRGFLVMESARMFGVEDERSVRAAAAIECMHAYSLVHDDLPCMDDDDLRRGRPTVHKKWDEATAVLVGDGLQALAFQFLADLDEQDAAKIELISSLAWAAGAEGMVLGQALDIEAESRSLPLSLEEIVALQRNKTGALIKWSARAGAILGREDPRPLEKYAKAIGLAFQIADDILDVEGDAETVGKAVGKDGDAGKATFVSLLGLEGAKARAGELVHEACDALAPYGTRADVLKEAALFVIERDR